MMQIARLLSISFSLVILADGQSALCCRQRNSSDAVGKKSDLTARVGELQVLNP